MTDQVVSLVPRKTPLAEAALMLTELCDRVDAGEDMDAVILSAFADVKLALGDSVDRRIAFDIWCKGAIEAARGAREDWDARVQLLKSVHERFKERTKEIVEAFPDLPYQGKLGRLAVQRNPASVHFAFGEKSVTKDLIRFWDIDSRYVRTSYSIDTTMVKADLAAGKELPWASLKTDGSHLRIRK